MFFFFFYKPSIFVFLKKKIQKLSSLPAEEKKKTVGDENMRYSLQRDTHNLRMSPWEYGKALTSGGGAGGGARRGNEKYYVGLPSLVRDRKFEYLKQ